jgi:hypothetical protein
MVPREVHTRLRVTTTSDEGRLSTIQQSNCKDRAYREDDDEYPVVGRLRVISNEIDEDMGNREDKGR